MSARDAAKRIERRRRRALAIARSTRRSPILASTPSRLELYYWMRLTRTLEERLVALYRQTKVVGGLFRSLGQEADAVGSAYALERRDILSPLIRNLGSMLVKGATPVEILKQYMAKGDSPTRGRELNIHFGDTERGFIGQISPLGDMVPVMAGVTLTFKMRERGSRRPRLRRRRRDVDRRVSRRDQLRRGAALPARRDRREQRLRVLDADVEADRREAVRRQGDRLRHSRRAGGRQRRPRRLRRDEARGRSRAARRRRDAHRADDLSPKGTRGARQPVVRAGRARSSAGQRENDPIDALHRASCATSSAFTTAEIDGVDERVRREVDEATDVAEQSAPPEALDALVGVYADPPAEQPLWFREGTAQRRRRARARRKAGARSTRRAEGATDGRDHLSRGDSRGAVRGDGARRERLLPRRRHRRVRRRVQGHRRAARQVRRSARHRLRRSRRSASSARRRARRTWACGRWSRCSSSTSSPTRTTCSRTTSRRRAIARSCRARWSCADRAADTCAAGRSTRRIPKRASSTRPGSRSSIRRRPRTPRA